MFEGREDRELSSRRQRKIFAFHLTVPFDHFTDSNAILFQTYPAIWASPSPVKLTHKLAITLVYEEDRAA
jgi:hypothetical protein